METKYKTIGSFLIYVTSIASLTIADFLVVSTFSSEYIADWAFYKSLIFIFGGMCVLGFDQLLLREVDYYDQFKKQFLLQSIVISFAVSLCLFFHMGNLGGSLLCFFVLFFYSNFLFEAGYWRGKKELLLSQLNTNLWKIVILVWLGIFIISKVNIYVINYYFYSMSISFFGLFFINLKLKNSKGKKDCYTKATKNLSREEKFKYLLVGFYFFIHNLSLVIANYGEQLITNLSGNKLLSSIIFSYITLYSSLALSMIGFVGFYLGPKIRYATEFGPVKYFKYQLCILAFGVISILVNSIFIYLLLPHIYFLKKLNFDFIFWLLIVLLTFCRIIYVLPSLCLGIFGDEDSLKKSSLYSLMVVLAYIFLFSLLMKIQSLSVNYSIMVLMIIHWLCKVIISNYYALKCLAKKDLECQVCS